MTDAKRRQKMIDKLKSLDDKTFMFTLSENLATRMIVAGDDELYRRMKRIDQTPQNAELMRMGK